MNSFNAIECTGISYTISTNKETGLVTIYMDGVDGKDLKVCDSESLRMVGVDITDYLQQIEDLENEVENFEAETAIQYSGFEDTIEDLESLIEELRDEIKELKEGADE